MVIGAPHYGHGNTTTRGSESVYLLVDIIGTEQTTLKVSNGSAEHWFGSSVAIRKDIMAIGAC